MHRYTLLLILSFCLLTSFTSRAQQYPSYETEEEESYTYTGQPSYEEEEEEEESYTYTGPPSYEEEEEESYSYTGEEEEASYTYTGTPYYEEEEEYYSEEYEEYSNENYNYNSGSYGGNSSANYGAGTSSGYSSGQSYSGSYNSNSSSSTPAFPTSLLTGFVVDIHFLAVDTRFQYIAYHYCSDLFPGYSQCAIYNGTESNSRLIATEIVVSAEIFATLPLAERKLYHSHAYGVKNGLLVLPGVTGDAELRALAGVINTYGKVVDYWHSYQTFPLGPPRLAYGLAADSELNTTILNQLDQALNLGTTWQQRKQQRASLKMPTIIEGASDYLTSGKYPQYVIEEFSLSSSNSTS